MGEIGSMNFRDYEKFLRVLISEDKIKQRLSDISKSICEHYNGEELLIVPVLKGSFILGADLGREIFVQRTNSCPGPEIRYDFIKTSTYKPGLKNKSEILETKIEIFPQIEDLLDKGGTLSLLQRLILDKNPKSLRTFILLEKILNSPSDEVKEIRKKIKADYLGFKVPDEWIVGYGIDSDESFRELPFIASLGKNL